MTRREKIIAVVMGGIVVWWAAIQMAAPKATSPAPVVLPVPGHVPASPEKITDGVRNYDLHEISRIIKMKNAPLDMTITVNPFEQITARKPDDEDQKKPLSDLTLSGIIWEEERPMALINDNVLRAGDSIGGFQIEKIFEDKVIFTKGMEKYILKLMPETEDRAVGGKEEGSDHGS